MTTPAPHDPLHRVERLAKVLDDAIRLPGTGIKIGLDAVIGLIPGVGDAAGLALGGGKAVILAPSEPFALKWKMARNVAIDAVTGLVPVLGDVVDVAYRSNRRNLALLRGHFRPEDAQRVAARTPRVLIVLGLAASAVMAWWLFFR